MNIKSRISELVEFYKGDNEVLDMIYDTFDSFATYVKTVNEAEHTMTILRFRLEKLEYRERLENIDRNRRIIHNGIIAGVKMLNNMCTSAQLPPFFEGDVSDRIAIGDFAGEITNIVFKERKK